MVSGERNFQAGAEVTRREAIRDRKCCLSAATSLLSLCSRVLFRNGTTLDITRREGGKYRNTARQLLRDGDTLNNTTSRKEQCQTMSECGEYLVTKITQSSPTCIMVCPMAMEYFTSAVSDVVLHVLELGVLCCAILCYHRSSIPMLSAHYDQSSHPMTTDCPHNALTYQPCRPMTYPTSHIPSCIHSITHAPVRCDYTALSLNSNMNK